MENIFTDKAPKPIGPYCQAMRHGDVVYCSGQIALDPLTGEFCGGDITAQTRQVCQNIGAVLAAAGTDFEHVIKTTCFLADMRDFAAFNQIYGSYFASAPARSCVAAAQLPKDALVEIEVIAAVAE